MELTSVLLIAIPVVVVVLLLVYFVSIYNRFQSLKNGAEATLGQIRVALKKRLDMIAQLVEAVQSYAKFERETLEKITQMRTSVLKADAREIQNIEA